MYGSSGRNLQSVLGGFNRTRAWYGCVNLFETCARSCRIGGGVSFAGLSWCGEELGFELRNSDSGLKSIGVYVATVSFVMSFWTSPCRPWGSFVVSAARNADVVFNIPVTAADVWGHHGITGLCIAIALFGLKLMLFSPSIAPHAKRERPARG